MTASISLRNVDFAYSAVKPVFQNLSLDLGGESPVIILGSSGCGKTTLLRLIAGLLKPAAGIIHRETIPTDSFPADPAQGAMFSRNAIASNGSAISMVFQEPRLLPWKTALENVSLPLIEGMGKKAALERAMRFLALVSLEDRAAAFPGELSGGQRQRVNLARAFACPSRILLMDEPFQSLDIPLRIELMDLTLSLLGDSGRLCLTVSHDPREAVYMGGRIIVLGESPRGLIHDETLRLDRKDRIYGSAAQGELEQRFLSLLKGRPDAN
jgi:NitT/TauT family transport system ATP-binding protein